MENKNKKNGKEHEVKIDFGLGGLFKGLGNLVDLVAEMSEKGEQIRERTQEFSGKGPLKDMNGVYGFSIKMGTGGKPEVNSFGNVKKSQNGPVVDEVREPMVDIFEEDDEIQIVAEMPGVAKNNINLELNDDVMVIRAENNKRKYHKELLLPARVKEDTLNYSYKNGILEVKLAKHS